MRLEILKSDHFTSITPWFEDAETRRRLGGFYPVMENLQQMVDASDKFAWLLWKEETPVGLIELEKELDIAYVLIMIAPDKRGQGLGHKLVAELPLLAKNIRTKTIRAYVETSGVASLRCFQAAGYVDVGEESGFICYELSV